MFYPSTHSLAEDPLLNGNYSHIPDDADASIAAAALFGVVGSLVSLGTSGAGTVTRQAHTFGQTTVPGNPRHFLRWAQTTAATAGTPKFCHKIDDVRTFAGRKVTFCGYYRSNTSLQVKLRQDFGAGGSPTADVSTSANGNTGTLPSTVDADGVAQWKPFSISYNLPSLVGLTLGSTAETSYLGIDILPPLSVTFQLDLCMLRLVEGGQADPTSRRRPFSEEERLLQRYYWAGSIQSQNAAFAVTFHQTMRAAPTLTADAGTADTATVDGFTLTHNAEAAIAITADARIAD